MLSSVASGARGALVRATVPRSAYVPARSLLKIASQSAQIGGNVIGGALLVALGTSGAILVNAATFAVSFALVRFVVGNYPNPGTATQGGVLRDSLRGAREILAHPGLARLLLLGWLVPTFSVAPEALGAPYVSSHHGSPALVGWWLAALPIGTIAGDLLGVRFMRQTLQQRLVVPAAAAGFVPYLFFVLDPQVGVALALLVVSGAFGMYSLGLDGRVRDTAPERLFARTMALNSAGLMTLQGLGFAFAGALAQAIGSAGAIALAGVCGLVAVAVLRSLPRPEPSIAYR
jgi:predicted MFS family arabinose efflux permease